MLGRKKMQRQIDELNARFETELKQEKHNFKLLSTINQVLIGLREGTAHAEFIAKTRKFLKEYIGGEKVTFVKHLPLKDAIELVRVLVEADVKIDDLENARAFSKKFVKLKALHNHPMFRIELKDDTVALLRVVYRALIDYHTQLFRDECDGLIGWLENVVAPPEVD